MALPVQATRPLRIHTAFGDDALLPQSLEGEEGVSRPFSFIVRAVSDQSTLAAADVLMQPALVEIELGGETRLVHGLVRRFSQLGRGADEMTQYELELVPWLELLAYTSDCKIFQQLSVPDIVEQVFSGLGFTDFRFENVKSYAPREYCVQYRESSLNFVSRLLEEEGMYYFFEHAKEKHTLVIADDPGAVQPCPGPASARMVNDAGGRAELDAVLSLVASAAVEPGKVTLRDYDYLQPSLQLERSVAGTAEKLEVYDYPGGYTQPDQGERYARLRLEAYEAQHQTVRGTSNCPWFITGCRFDLAGHYRKDLNQAYLLTRVKHSASQADIRAQGHRFDYENEFEAMPHKVPYRPERRTTKPVVYGSQTAVVVGKAGEEIYVDKHSRVKVQFHWDREGKKDENSSCWVRVSVAWAGKGYGSLQVPRIGQEVIVDFLEGDPDQPIITGRVYNAEQTPPCDPGGKGGVVSGMRSKTHKGGGFNEMTMDDTKGKEKISIHAQYDMVTNVEHDDTQTVKNHRTVSITEGNLKEDVVAGTATYHVKGAVKETYDATLDTTVTGAVTEKFDATQATTAKNDITITSSSGKIHIKASTEIQLQVGSSTLLMKSDGSIKLTGVAIGIDGSQEVRTHGGNVMSKADGNHDIEGSLVKSNGAVSNTVQGGMVMLNP